jgi:hypothetical protein
VVLVTQGIGYLSEFISEDLNAQLLMHRRHGGERGDEIVNTRSGEANGVQYALNIVQGVADDKQADIMGYFIFSG